MLQEQKSVTENYFFPRKKSKFKRRKLFSLKFHGNSLHYSYKIFLHSSPLQETSGTIFVVEFWTSFCFEMPGYYLIPIRKNKNLYHVDLVTKGSPTRPIVTCDTFIMNNVVFLWLPEHQEISYWCYQNQVDLSNSCLYLTFIPG